MDLTTSIYKSTKEYPSEERFGLVSQMRRAATSIPANIAEGQGRWTNKEFKRFLAISRGSLFELETFLELSERLRLLSSPNTKVLLDSCSEIGKMLNGLMNSLDLEN